MLSSKKSSVVDHVIIPSSSCRLVSWIIDSVRGFDIESECLVIPTNTCMVYGTVDWMDFQSVNLRCCSRWFGSKELTSSVDDCFLDTPATPRPEYKLSFSRIYSQSLSQQATIHHHVPRQVSPSSTILLLFLAPRAHPHRRRRCLRHLWSHQFWR